MIKLKFPKNDKTTFVMANQIKSFRPPTEVSIDVELWL